MLIGMLRKAWGKVGVGVVTWIEHLFARLEGRAVCGREDRSKILHIEEHIFERGKKRCVYVCQADSEGLCVCWCLVDVCVYLSWVCVWGICPCIRICWVSGYAYCVSVCILYLVYVFGVYVCVLGELCVCVLGVCVYWV